MTHFTDCFLRCARMEPPDSLSLVVVNDGLLLFFIVTFVHVRLEICNNGGKMIADQNLCISLYCFLFYHSSLYFYVHCYISHDLHFAELIKDTLLMLKR